MTIAPSIEKTRADHDAPQTESEEAVDGVSIVIPAYNEENGIGPVLEDLVESLDSLDGGVPIEVIVVNDCSTDKTAAKVEPFIGERIRMVEHLQNRGYGAALKTGIRHAKHSWILITDADGTYPNEFIPDVLAHRDDHEMVVGARTGKNSHIPLIRRPPKWVLRKLAAKLSNQDIPDLNSGFRLMKREIVEKYLNILPDGFSFTTTITLAMFSAGYRVRYVPIDYRRREGKSKIHPIKDTINFVKLIIRTIIYFDPLRVFIPVAFFFFLASLAVGFGSYFALGQLMDVTTVVLFITGVQLLAIGMLADMLNRRLS